MSDYLQWRSDRRKCPRCGVQLEVSNAIYCFGLCGLIFGIIIGSSHHWAFGNEWLRLAIAVLICWMVFPTIVRVNGSWRAVAGEQKTTAGIRKWTKLVPVSLLALAIAFGITYTLCIIIFCN